MILLSVIDPYLTAYFMIICIFANDARLLFIYYQG